MTVPWNSTWHLSSPIYQPLLEAASSWSLSQEDWPSLDDYNRLLQSTPPVLTASGKPVHCVPQSTDQYEQRTYLTGELQTRSQNWHDLFNMLVWRTFPQTKATINRLHTQNSPQTPNLDRGTARDVLTLFDESGVIVACNNDNLIDMLRQRQWKTLFWQHSSELTRDMKFYIFGHSLYEKALNPYIGITGKALIFQVSSSFNALPAPIQLSEMDSKVTEYFLNPESLQTTANLSPLPLLGIPGWWPDNNLEHFYDNTHYFRPARVK